MAAPVLPMDNEIALTARRMEDLLARQRRAFTEQVAPSAEERIAKLDALIASIIQHEPQILDACVADFGHRSRDSTRFTDVANVIEGIKYCKKRLRGWMKPEKRSPAFPLGLLGATAEVRYQPLGVVGIVSPWNFPFTLALGPLAWVLAAGNRAILKPSEVTPACAAVIADIVKTAFAETDVAVVTGSPEVGAAFTRLPFDHLVFTGGTSIARHVMRAAADNLVPVTLELGGKCPVIIGRGADMEDVAAKVMNGKCLNAGQICLAPDYVLVPEERKAELVDALRAATAAMFDGLRDNPDYTSVVNERHRRRIQGYLDDAREKGAELVELNPRGESFEGQKSHKMPPTLVLGVTDDMTIMKEEIFGPAMPVKTYRAIDEAVSYVNAHERPLALYYFGHDAEERERVLSRTTSGGVTVNDVVMHFAQDDLPFGGVGPSGMGAYHGREGFRTFSLARSVFTQTRVGMLGKMIRPPYGDRFRKLVSSMIKP
ncbi:MAG: coniferyl aldehyde dehydrogenase [Deltaproteobacteria bacterium]|nr:coniferyl aldehyde dehydrogenase [Deltaproteobacteria bacterium]